MSEEEVKEKLKEISFICAGNTVAHIQNETFRLVINLSVSHPTVVCKLLPMSFVNLVKHMSFHQPSVGIGRSAILAFNLITTVLKHLPVEMINKDNLKNLVLSHSVLAMALFFTNIRRTIIRSSLKKLFALWSSRPEVFTLLNDLLAAATPNSSFLAICSLISRYLKNTESSDSDKLNKLYENCVQHITKSSLFQGKSSPSELAIISSADFIENGLTPERFQNDFLPVIQRSLLRSPEMCMKASAQIIQKITFDLSSFTEALLFGSNTSSSYLVTHLRSQSVDVREDAGLLLTAVFNKCYGIPASRQRVMDILFDTIMDSPEAKKSTTEVKLFVWTVIGRFVSQSNSSQKSSKLHQGLPIGIIHKTSLSDSSMETSINHLFNKLMAFMKQEANETVLVCAIENCTEWAYLYRSVNYEMFITWLKDVSFNNKTPLSIRLGLRCLTNALFRKADQMEALTPLIPSLLEYWHYCMRQVSGPLVHSEAIVTCALLLRYYSVYASGHSDVTDNNQWLTFWKSLLNTEEKNSLVCWKMNAITNHQVLSALVTVCDKLLRDFSAKLNQSITSAAQKMFLNLICNRENENIRKLALLSLRQCLTFTSTGDFLSFSLCQQLEEWLSLFDTNNDDHSIINADDDSSSSQSAIKAAYIKDCLLTLTKFPETRLYDNGPSNNPILLHNPNDLLSKLAIQCLFICSRPYMMSSYPTLWITILKQLAVNESRQEAFIELHRDNLINGFICQDSLNKVNENALAFLIRFWPKQLLSNLLSTVSCLMESDDFLSVSFNEMGILMNADNRLFDSAFIDSLPTYDTDSTANIRRENKAYSHKDQLLDIQLRKEQQALKKQQKHTQSSSSNKEQQDEEEDPYAKLTAKQREMVQVKLDGEKVVREKVKKLFYRMSHLIEIINVACSAASYSTLEDHIAILAKTFTKSFLPSPLACVPAAKFIKQLSIIATESLEQGKGSHHQQVTYYASKPISNWIALSTFWSLRVLQPAWSLAQLQWPSHVYDKALTSYWKWLTTHFQPWTSTALNNQTNSVLDYLLYKVDNGKMSKSEFAFLWPTFNKLLQVWCERFNLSIKNAEGSPLHQTTTFSCTGTSEIHLIKKLLSEFDWLRDEHIITVLDIVKKQYQIYYQTNEFLPHANLIQSLQDLLSCSISNPVEVLIRDIFALIAAACLEHNYLYTEWDTIHVLLKGLLYPSADVRIVACKTLYTILPSIKHLLAAESPTSENHQKLTDVLFIAMHYKKTEETTTYATNLFSQLQLEVNPNTLEITLSLIAHPVAEVRVAASESLAVLLNNFPSKIREINAALWKIYLDAFQIPPPVRDESGRVVIPSPPDNWLPRWGVAKALQLCCDLYENEMDLISDLFRQLVNRALGDRNQSVREEMLTCGRLFLDKYGKKMVTILLPILDEFLSNAPDEASYDNARQGVVVLTGSLARHLDSNDPKIRNILGKLVEALRINSQQVQIAVSEVMAPLMRPLNDTERRALLEQLIITLFKGNGLAERRGAAFGISGLVKGIGILVLKSNQIMERLIEALQDKSDAQKREGALFCVETMGSTLGKLFEPYIVAVIPHLLLAFGDQNSHVRKAANDAAKSIMSRLSAHGVKLVLPSLLAALEQDSWRTKSGSTELLGSMAYCAPKQLSACLPQIVPRLMEVMTDSHTKVQNSAAEALKKIASVIKNPEVQSLVPTLLEALQDPINKTTPCLKILLSTRFLHVIDPASLAIIMPVLKRAFSDRVTDTKKMAAQIVGNMYSLADAKDLQPYMDTLLPGLKNVLMDPEPQVRGIAAKALGAMVKESDDSCFKELLPWLMAALASESSTVDRSGAAQGLAEVVGSRGVEQLKVLMDDAIVAASDLSHPPHVRDGYIQLFTYLPDVFKTEFALYLDSILPPILKALSDESEFIRSSALQAGRSIVKQYSETSVELLLPRLEEGLLDYNWRIRFASVQLLGDLLFKLSGVSGKGTTEALDEDETFGTEDGARTLGDKLGVERRKQMLSRLCMSRCDISLQVRQHAAHVWKLVVINTPRTLREILAPLLHLLIDSLHSVNSDIKEIAARALGDIVRKLGERLLPDLVPILEKDLQSTDEKNRQGVCIALQEVLKNSPRETVENSMENIIGPLRIALCDEEESVRSAAAETANLVTEKLGSKAMQELLAHIIPQLDNEETEENALGALKELLLVRGRMVMPILLPQLISPKVNTRAFSYLADVAGESLTKHLDKLVPSLAKAVEENLDKENEALEVQQCATALFSIRDADGIRIIFRCLTIVPNLTNVSAKRACLLLLTKYLQMVQQAIESSTIQTVKSTPNKAIVKRPTGGAAAQQNHSDDDSDEDSDDDSDDDDDYEPDSDETSDEEDLEDLGEIIANHYLDILRVSVQQLSSDDDVKLLRQAYHCTETCLQAWRAEQYNAYLHRFHNLIEIAVSDRRQNLIRQGKLAKGDDNFLLPGFALDDLGVEPFMKTYREAALQGNADTKEVAALAMFMCVAHASPKALEKSVVRAAGPLIRVMGDRSCLNFKATMVDTLGIMVQKCPTAMRPFATQLQSTFLRTLMDPLRSIRIASVRALSHILPDNKKVDTLFTDLVTNYCQATSDFRDTSLEVLRLCLTPCWPNLSEKCRSEVAHWIPIYLQQLDLTEASEKEHILVAAVMAEYCKLHVNMLQQHVIQAIKDCNPRLWQISHATAHLLMLLFRDIPQQLLDPQHVDKEFRDTIQKGIKFFCQNEQVPVCVAGFKAWAYAVKYLVITTNTEELQVYMPLIQRGIKHENVEVKKAAIRSCVFVGMQCHKTAKLDLFSRVIFAVLMNGTRERDSAVRAVSEQGIADLCGLSILPKATNARDIEGDAKTNKDYSLLDSFLESLDPGLKNSVEELTTRIKKNPPVRQECPQLDNIKLVD